MAIQRRTFAGIVILLVLVAALVALAASVRASESPGIPPESIVLEADHNSGHDPVWEERHYYFKPTWGIRGSGQPESGEIWFNAFPGKSGVYNVRLDVIAEQDGSPHYAVYAEQRLLQKGRFPYPRGRRDCDARGEAMSIELGSHDINKGDKIRIWGESVYECGEKGAYSLWYRLVFTPDG